jgi:tetrahydromethanopterin S-methyltransferase subunit H
MLGYRYITSIVTIATETAITKLAMRFRADKMGIPIIIGSSANETKIETAKDIMEINIMNATYAL